MERIERTLNGSFIFTSVLQSLKHSQVLSCCFLDIDVKMSFHKLKIPREIISHGWILCYKDTSR